jgi:DNA (cytosine-5)-methyltransferase 1
MNPSNQFQINLINSDFLLEKFDVKYDLVVGNPPYKKVTNNKDLLKKYKNGVFNQNTNNLFSFFIEKALSIGDNVAFIIPKSLINSPEFDLTRTLLLKYNLNKIVDYGEKAFKGVKIETISFLVEKKVKSSEVFIESYIRKNYVSASKKYVFSKEFPYWLLYRNKQFDHVASIMKLDVFNAFRDRQITKKHTKSKGKIRLLKSRNIANNTVLDISGYDCYLDDAEPFAVSKYLNKESVVMIPNLTYYPRASFLPKNTIVDGSVALLTLKNGSREPTKKDLDFYSSESFVEYYRVARNFGTRSLNIDNNSVFFFGILK